MYYVGTYEAQSGRFTPRLAVKAKGGMSHSYKRSVSINRQAVYRKPAERGGVYSAYRKPLRGILPVSFPKSERAA